MKAADELAKHVGVKPACAALEVSRSTLYRRRGPSTGQQQPRPTPARALSETERGEVFDTLCSERFVDRSPAEVVATLLDEEVYLCSERTMYRVLAFEVPVQERRAQRNCRQEIRAPRSMGRSSRTLRQRCAEAQTAPGGRLHQSSHPFPHHTGHCSLINPVECPIVVDRFRFS